MLIKQIKFKSCRRVLSRLYAVQKYQLPYQKCKNPQYYAYCGFGDEGEIRILPPRTKKTPISR